MPEMIGELMEVAGMGPEETELMRGFEPAVTRQLDALARSTCDRIVAAPEIRATLADPARRQWLEARVKDFVSRVVGGAYGAAMAEWLLGFGSEIISLGMAGLHLVMTLGMVLHDELIGLSQREYADEPEMALRMRPTIRKGIDVCQAMLWGAYERSLASQRQAMLELATPVVEVWQGILVMPLIGTIDTRRAKQITEVLLDRIITHEASMVLVDITGVPVVDTEVANHVIRTIQAARLLGAKCFVVGIRPEIAQTLVHLGVDLTGITTAASLYSGLQEAFRELGLRVVQDATAD